MANRVRKITKPAAIAIDESLLDIEGS